MAGRCFKAPSTLRSAVAKVLAAAVAVYGIRAFIKRKIGSYMLLKIHFVFFAPHWTIWQSWRCLCGLGIMAAGVSINLQGKKLKGGEKRTAAVYQRNMIYFWKNFLLL